MVHKRAPAYRPTCTLTPIAPPAPAANFYEIKPALLNLVMKEQFSGASTDDAAAHLNNFVEVRCRNIRM
jgi:hypothetical protein